MTTIVAGCAIINPNKELLLVHKIKHDRYEFPGGKQEDGETLEQTAIREVKEEIGVDVRGVYLYHSHVFQSSGRNIKGFVYRASLVDGQTPQVQPDEIEKLSHVAWIPIREYEQHTVSANVAHFCADYTKRYLS